MVGCTFCRRERAPLHWPPMESLWERSCRAEGEKPHHYWQVYLTEGDFSVWVGEPCAHCTDSSKYSEYSWCWDLFSWLTPAGEERIKLHFLDCIFQVSLWVGLIHVFHFSFCQCNEPSCAAFTWGLFFGRNKISLLKNTQCFPGLSQDW